MDLVYELILPADFLVRNRLIANQAGLEDARQPEYLHQARRPRARSLRPPCGWHARNATHPTGCLRRGGDGASDLAPDPLAALAGARGLSPAHDVFAGRRTRGVLRRHPTWTARHAPLRRGSRLLPAE